MTDPLFALTSAVLLRNDHVPLLVQSLRDAHLRVYGINGNNNRTSCFLRALKWTVCIQRQRWLLSCHALSPLECGVMTGGSTIETFFLRSTSRKHIRSISKYLETN